jgi:small subunit ribosomal protein S9
MTEKKAAGKKDAKKTGIIVFATGKRKRAVARAWFRKGRGMVRINFIPLELLKNELARMTISEPLVLAGDKWKGMDINVNVRGGGVMGQAEAARQAIARGLAEKNPDLKGMFTEYNRSMLISDPRRTEPHKPPRSSQGPRRYKQRSKR